MSDTVTIDNSVNGDMKRVITWQFDNAEKLRDTIYIFRDFFNASIKNVADKIESVVNFAGVETADDYALSIWGRLLGVDRPTVLVNGVETPLLAEAYRKLLVARFRLLNSDASAVAYGDFLTALFGNSVQITQDGGMALKFSYTGTAPSEGNTEEHHLYRLFTDKPDAIFVYPAGVKDDTKSDGPVFGFDGQWTLMDNGQPAVKDGRKKAELTIQNTSVNAEKCRITATVYSVNTYPYYISPVLAIIVNNHEYSAVTWRKFYDFGSSSSPKTYTVVFDGIFHSEDVQVGDILNVYYSYLPSRSPTEVNNIRARIDGIERYESYGHDVTIPARSIFSGLSTGERFYTLGDNIIRAGESKTVFVCSDSTISSGTISGRDTSNFQYFSYPADEDAVEGNLILDVARSGGDNTIPWNNVPEYSPFASIEPAGTDDFKVVNFDHGCFAWKRDIAQINQEQL